MLPVVATPSEVARQIVLYTWLTVGASIALWPLATSWVYGALACVAGVAFVVEAHRLFSATRKGLTGNPMRLFHLSNSYLAFVFVAVAVDAFLR
jgi:protoheme IX farnesyltransferase